MAPLAALTGVVIGAVLSYLFSYLGERRREEWARPGRPGSRFRLDSDRGPGSRIATAVDGGAETRE
ncbi:hypothetical protein Vau01_124560 [Virgisporangium aurantiacum]|uniref:Uncharacterized protein n=1 Tax=Virgisporangium aurantiacum TaxID=175570 RepID=A0A8J3ZP05_9ACTN|nr:hypothetical protein Vau01_124560 [Virgisporangium aurantiacum]